MVGADEFALKVLARRAVDGVSIDLAVSIDLIALTGEVLVFCVNVESVGLGLDSTQFAAKIFVIRPKPELIGVGGLVFYAVVDIVVRDAGSCAEGYLASKVGEEV